jgi:hypothetical protein
LVEAIRRHPLAAYFVTACAVSWLGVAGGSTLIVIVWHTVWNAVALAAAVISPALVAVTSAHNVPSSTPA